jgi:hypothetical protein
MEVGTSCSYNRLEPFNARGLALSTRIVITIKKIEEHPNQVKAPMTPPFDSCPTPVFFRETSWWYKKVLIRI